MIAKPFLKWAGGKTQLIKQLQYPDELKQGLITSYYEPFVGGGAVFFDIINNYPIKSAYLSDINVELILVYQTIQKQVSKLIDLLDIYQTEYLSLDEASRVAYFYDIRAEYNCSHKNYKRITKNAIRQAAQIIFLNKTCFNGLFRVNKSGKFNVPFGKYKNPKILDAENLIKVAQILQSVSLKVADFSELEKLPVNQNSFIYFDPPYRPISKTSTFTSYSTFQFDNMAQIKLANTFKLLDKTGAKLMLSNSKPIDPKDNFFVKHYADFNIMNIKANRMINSVASKRGKIAELLITNYVVGE
ncbi:Dam family site-specific DNA-(adenine-N6)-methyltransferase [Candidatus Halobeggiatoa sp. HSG11]|nr:Dam family site-specific DNA-(adenine-N6)-methyltransferase [Candidatus Halobeggiatoa sp. HSG11]